MANKDYSSSLCSELMTQAADPALEYRLRPTRYEPGHVLKLGVEGVVPAVQGQAELTVDKFLGGGFAGQVYRCRLDRLDLPSDAQIPGLQVGSLYTVKIIIPPSRFSLFFRNTVYWLAFQGPFSAQVNYSACRAGLLWQKLIRRAGRAVFGRETAVKDAYASFHDPTLGAYGEITEWIEGRMWRLESDDALRRRARWRTLDVAETRSAEYVAKRRFMADMVRMLHDLGAPEFARQYEWYTLKSQPNVLKRTDLGEEGPAGGLCAIDFRAGLALLPFLPMSPADFKLIVQGLVRRAALVQFDRGDMKKLDAFLARRADDFGDLQPMIEELKLRDNAYRRSLPDLTHHGIRLLWDAGLRRDVRGGLVDGYAAADRADAAFSRLLREGSAARFLAWYLLGAIPMAGRLLRRLWGNAAYRRHVKRALTSLSYLGRALAARAAYILVAWHRAGRTSEQRTRRLHRHPVVFLWSDARWA